MATQPACVILLMGVSGCGKSTIGTLLADELGWPFRDANSFHPATNVEKMSRGVPLDDEDRWPWLMAIRAWIDERLARGECAIVSCSALKRAYRDILLAGEPRVRLVHLAGEAELIAARLARRSDHFMPPALLASQFAALEPPGADERALVVPIASPPDTIVGRIVSEIGRLPG